MVKKTLKRERSEGTNVKAEESDVTVVEDRCAKRQRLPTAQDEVIILD